MDNIIEMTESPGNGKSIQNDEIDLIEVFKKIWAGRKTIYKSVAIFFVLGLIVAFGTPREYKSEVTLLVESGANGSGVTNLLQQFGGLTGINIGGRSDEEALTPALYPDIIKSTPFLLELLNQKVTESKYDSTLTVANYLDRHRRSSLTGTFIGYVIGLPGKLIGLFKGKPKAQVVKSETHGPLKLTQKQTDLANSLAGCIKTKEGESSGILIISVEVQDPVVAAQLADSVVKSLTYYIIEYRTQKAKNDLQFIRDRHDEAETKFISTQRTLAMYRDQNKNIISAFSSTEGERLQAEYNLAFNIYNGLSQQLEQAKIKVQEKTPVFKIIDPAKVPLIKSKPNTSLTLMVMIFLGGILGFAIIISKAVYRSLFKK